MPSLIRLFKIGRKVQKVATLIEEANVSKSLWSSRTFWFNLLTAAAETTQLVSGTNLVPPGYLAIAAGAINIALRAVTSQPVHVVPPKP